MPPPKQNKNKKNHHPPTLKQQENNRHLPGPPKQQKKKHPRPKQQKTNMPAQTAPKEKTRPMPNPAPSLKRHRNMATRPNSAAVWAGGCFFSLKCLGLGRAYMKLPPQFAENQIVWGKGARAVFFLCCLGGVVF